MIMRGLTAALLRMLMLVELTGCASRVATPDQVFQSFMDRCGDNLFSRKFDQAVEACSQFLESSRHDPKVNGVSPVGYLWRGIAYAGNRQYDRAIEDLSEDVQLMGGHDTTSLTMRGDVYSLKGQYDLAIRDYDDAIKGHEYILSKSTSSPQLAMTRVELAWIYKQRSRIFRFQGKQAKATVDFDKARQLNPSGILEPPIFRILDACPATGSRPC